MFLDPRPKAKLDVVIDEILIEMERYSPTADEYGTLLGRLKDLHKMKQEENPHRVNPDVVVQSVVHILGIALILRHEQFNIITSKALSFVPRVR